MCDKNARVEAHSYVLNIIIFLQVTITTKLYGHDRKTNLNRNKNIEFGHEINTIEN